jgi:pimeloyl-ACP methyl ester carboxylesterase
MAMRGFAGLSAVLALSLPAAALGESAPVPAIPDALAQQYTHPQQQVAIGDGRTLNLFCLGEGAPTVIFDSGLSDWSVIWAPVQPGVAKRTRACSYDRAGMGFSPPAKDAPARTPAAIVDDLHALIHAAKIAGPVVLVGHSLGGFNMKLYAALYPEDVAGVVLVDPSEERTLARTGDAVAARFGPAVAARYAIGWIADLPEATAHFADCASAAAKAPLDPVSDLYKHCSDPVRTPLGPAIAAHRQALQVSATYQATQASEFANSVFGDAHFDPVYERLFAGNAFGDKPLIVLTHSIHESGDPLDEADFYGWNLMHAQTAALSTRGLNRIVPDTHHNIEVDRPQAVIDAVFEVLDALAAQPSSKPET